MPTGLPVPAIYATGQNERSTTNWWISPVAKAGGFSLHAGVVTQAHQRKNLERTCHP